MVKNTLIPDKGFQNTEIVYQAVIAQSVEPRHIFVSINERLKRGGFEFHRFPFLMKEIFLNIIIA